jgi:hypothetical protein
MAAPLGLLFREEIALLIFWCLICGNQTILKKKYELIRKLIFSTDYGPITCWGFTRGAWGLATILFILVNMATLNQVTNYQKITFMSLGTCIKIIPLGLF